MIPDRLYWRQIWGSDLPRKGSNSAETPLPYEALSCRKKAPGNRCMSGNTCGCRISWTYRWSVMVTRINPKIDRVLWAMAPIPSQQLWQRCVALKQMQDSGVHYEVSTHKQDCHHC
ncbi:UNVERIFIED_CONTAM: hypothetical protein NCL1_29049 [Trichonephila clavipes]